MKIKNIKQFLVFLLIDLIFVFCVFSFLKFIFNRVKGYLLSLQSLDLDLQSLEESFLENASNLNLDLLGGNLEIINQIVQKITFYSVYALLGIFLLYCIFQAINWNLCYNNLKFKNFGRYLLKFILINIPIFVIISYILYGIIYNFKDLVLGSWISGTYLENQFSFGGSLPLLIILIVLFLLVEFLGINIYVLMNKYKMKDTLIKSFNNLKDYKLDLRFLGYMVGFILISFTSVFNPILCLILFLSLFGILRIDFSRNLK